MLRLHLFENWSFYEWMCRKIEIELQKSVLGNKCMYFGDIE
jgi:hypothetical protein